LLNDKAGKYTEKAKVYINIAMIYSDLNQMKNTLKYFEKSLKISRMLNNRADISARLMDVATILIVNKQYDNALKKLNQALKIANSLNDARLLRTCYNLMSQCYRAYGNTKKSKEYFDKFVIYDTEVKNEGTKTREKEAESKLTAAEKRQKILEAEKLAKNLQFDLLEVRKKASEDSLNYALIASEDSLSKMERAKSAIELSNELLQKDKKLQKLLIEKQRKDEQTYKLIIFGSVIAAFLLVLIIIAAIITNINRKKTNKKLANQNIEIVKQKNEIQNKSNDLSTAFDKIKFQNKNIMQSINYAQRIQEAMLPKAIGMQNIIPDSFIYFKPRDIVSGDFYWFYEFDKNSDTNKKLQNTLKNSNKKIFISAVDCTGHGVPGAFMSMLGFNLLNDVVNKGVHNPSEILKILHNGIKSSLNQNATKNRDGMDMALCVINTDEKTLEFAGAQNPLVYIQENQMYRLRGNKIPVGGFQVEVGEYNKHVIKIDKPTWCYIFSDGFHDQFGGPQGRKFMGKNFRDLLFEIHQMPMDEQKKILDMVIVEWMGDKHEQIDDMLIIGFKIDLEDSKIVISN